MSRQVSEVCFESVDSRGRGATKLDFVFFISFTLVEYRLRNHNVVTSQSRSFGTGISESL